MFCHIYGKYIRHFAFKFACYFKFYIVILFLCCLFSWFLEIIFSILLLLLMSSFYTSSCVIFFHFLMDLHLANSFFIWIFLCRVRDENLSYIFFPLYMVSFPNNMFGRVSYFPIKLCYFLYHIRCFLHMLDSASIDLLKNFLCYNMFWYVIGHFSETFLFFFFSETFQVLNMV